MDSPTHCGSFCMGSLECISRKEEALEGSHDVEGAKQVAAMDVPFVRKLRVHADSELEEDRLVILPDEQKQIDNAALGKQVSISAGRPIGAEYWDLDEKLAYMDHHGISTSVLSLANPWLDFLPIQEQTSMATLLNDDMEAICANSQGRFYAFGVTPQSLEEAIAELHHIATLPHVRGIILGTSGFGKGLDDPAMLDFYQTVRDLLRSAFSILPHLVVDQLGLTIFLHPHYGVGNEHYHNYGHALFLALGFTFETTVAVSQLILSGMLDQVPTLKLLLAHSGGTLPFLAGRLDSCVAHDLAISTKLQHAPSHYLKGFYYDAIAYHTPALQCLIDFVGSDRIVFGTDNPFFPPHIEEGGPTINESDWPSTIANYETLACLDVGVQNAILRENAKKLLKL
ncbi:2-amino-3-carboxymuconate-6-semialdehyde decarboxylase, partial [Globisporangium splendens]